MVKDDMRGLTVRLTLSAGGQRERSDAPGCLARRPLQQYIADLRACRVRELEEKRINKEMAHIRQKFRGTAALIASPSTNGD